MSTRLLIGMPVYNGSIFLASALDALLNQSFKDFKIIISDDASRDATRLICEEYTKKDSRITYIRQERNLGLFDNFKFTLESANQEEYFMWAAQDDMWEKDFIQTCISILDRNKDIGLAGTAMAEIDSYGRVLRELPWLVKLSGKSSLRHIAHYVLEPEILGRCNIMYGIWKLSALKEVWAVYPQTKVWGQDYIFVLAGLSRFPVQIDSQILFKKRLGGYSSVDALKDDKVSSVNKITVDNPKNHIFPFGRFKSYFKGHMQALKGTPYRPFVAFLLLLRLPRALLIHLKAKIR